jgi:DNA-binding transcriptional LysR family regulator
MRLKGRAVALRKEPQTVRCPMKFTLRQLEYFIAAGETGSITLASERASISQPSISTAISHLERELGTQLFLRHHAQGLSLTPAGRAVLREAKQLIRHAEGLYSVRAEMEQVRGTLSVGCLVTLAPLIMPALSQSFVKQHPGAIIRQSENHQEGLLEGLRRAEIDIAVTYDLQISKAVEFSRLAALPPYALFGASDPLHKADSVTIRELAALPLILLDLPISREYFIGLFMKHGYEPNIAYRSPNQEIVRTMVANGYGYALFNARPKSNIALDGRPLYPVPIAGKHPPAVIGLATLRELAKPRLVAAFETHCRELILEGNIPGMVTP